MLIWNDFRIGYTERYYFTQRLNLKVIKLSSALYSFIFQLIANKLKDYATDDFYGLIRCAINIEIEIFSVFFCFYVICHYNHYIFMVFISFMDKTGNANDDSRHRRKCLRHIMFQVHNSYVIFLLVCFCFCFAIQGFSVKKA